MAAVQPSNKMPVVTDLKDFDLRSGNLLERSVFNNRLLVIVFCIIASVFLGYHASKLRVNASYDRMIPQSHPYIRNYFNNKEALRPLANSVRIVIENQKGDIFDPKFLDVVRKVNDVMFLKPGVDREFVNSIWSPYATWVEVTEAGFRGGPVLPENFHGSSQDMAQLHRNILKAGIVGTLVGKDFRSCMVVVPLHDLLPDNVTPLDYGKFSNDLERQIRSLGGNGIVVHIIGFPKLVGDMITGLYQVMWFFAISALLVAGMIFFYTRCIRSTILLISLSILSVVWMLGLIQLAGYVLDPYSILVPFLIFAIGASHGAQKMNGVMQDIARGVHRYVAARYTFRRLFAAGFTALLTNVVGFAVLMVIDIPVIHDLALTTSIGVCVLIFTILLLVPVCLSYIGVSPYAARRRLKLDTREEEGARAWWLRNVPKLTHRRPAIIVLCCAGVFWAGAFVVSTHLQTGDLGSGAAELRPNSRYNQDVRYINKVYSAAGDQFAIIVKTPTDGLMKFPSLIEMDRLEQALKQVHGVQSTVSASDLVRFSISGLNDGNFKWLTISRNPFLLSDALGGITANHPDVINNDHSTGTVIAYLTDHRAGTLSAVLQTVVDFGKAHNTAGLQFLPAAGSAGIAAITNIVVHTSQRTMLIYLYGAVMTLCLIAFRSWRAVIVGIIPLLLTSTFCEALMVTLGIGVKGETLPVIALGVGVGVDYTLYILIVQLALLRRGSSLEEAYTNALRFTGKIVALVGCTMAAGVITWIWSPLKFQADMGVLLAFMFLWNMVGALILIPALSHFLLVPKIRLGEATDRATRSAALVNPGVQGK